MIIVKEGNWVCGLFFKRKNYLSLNYILPFEIFAPNVRATASEARNSDGSRIMK